MEAVEGSARAKAGSAISLINPFRSTGAIWQMPLMFCPMAGRTTFVLATDLKLRAPGDSALCAPHLA